MSELLVFSEAPATLARVLGARLDAPAKQRLRELGVDFDRPFAPAYPLAVWRKVVEYAGVLVAPNESFDRQQFALGSLFITAYTETMIGRATLGLMRLVGPKRTLERMAKTLRTGNNYSQTELVELSPTRFELRCNHVQNPSFYRGMFKTGLEHTGTPNVEVTTVAIEGAVDHEAVTFRITW